MLKYLFKINFFIFGKMVLTFSKSRINNIKFELSYLFDNKRFSNNGRALLVDTKKYTFLHHFKFERIKNCQGYKIYCIQFIYFSVSRFEFKK